MRKIPLNRFELISQSDIFLQFFRIESTPPGSIDSTPNRHTFNELFLITSGSGSHIVDFVEYPVQPNTLFIVGRGDVHYWDVETIPTGFVILFEQDPFHLFGNEEFAAQIELFRTYCQAAYHLTDDEAAWFQRMMENIEFEFNAGEFGRLEMIVSIVQMMLIRTQRLFLSRQTPRQDESVANQRIARQFLELVDQTINDNLSVGQLAETLGITLAHLTTMVKQVMGVSAGSLLRQRQVLEAKRLLAHTDLTTAEIAYALNFKDPSYFGRFFKRETSSTPGYFRKQFKRKYQNS